jgi:hypothetical protein
MRLDQLKQFATVDDSLPVVPQRPLIRLNAKTYEEAIRHNGTVWAKIPNGLIDWWIVKEGGKVKHSPDTLVEDIRRMM